MEPANLKGAGSGIALALLLASVLAFAQDAPADADDLQPAVDTSAALGPAVDTSAASPQAPADAKPPAASPEPAPAVASEASGGKVMDSLELGRTEITGNQELPKVLYIVPWHKADPGNLIGKPVNTLLDEVLAPIDRDEFIRQVDYYDDLYGDK
jgi:hypothetical protein